MRWSCGNRRIPLAELHAEGVKVDHRFAVSRKAYLSPRTIAFNVQGVRLAVHRVTGEVRILHSVHAADIGRPINPLQCRGQLDGAVAMGYGWALIENMVHDQGHMVNPQLRNCRVPAFADTPHTDIFFADTVDFDRAPGGEVPGRMRHQSGGAGRRQCPGRCHGVALRPPALHARPPVPRPGRSEMTVSIVTQTSVRPERSEDFARWQGETSQLVARFPGFIEQRLMPPNPPLQVDWVILQRFQAIEDAQRWLASTERQARIEGAAPMLVGRDDVHIVRDSEGGIKPAPVSAVISTRVKPGREAEYRAWERRIAAAQSRAPGLQGYRFEPPVPGIQEDFVAILRFDSQANLQAWLDSPVRRQLVAEAEPLTVEFHARLGTGFEQWFRDESGAPAALPVWKMDMIVLLLLYPIVFLFGVYVHTPLFMNALHLPFAVALFLGNIVSVGLTGVLVPWVARHMTWWLQPRANAVRANLLGALLICAFYTACVAVFWKVY